MPNFRRNFLQGGIFFFTVVSAGRAPLFASDDARRWLGQCFREERRERPFRVEAIVLLPDHLHTIWALPEGDADFSTRWRSLKSRFTRLWLAANGSEQTPLLGQRAERRRGVWQARFFEHTIQDDNDFTRHVEYIHYNPVKHGYVSRPSEWAWSSFHRFVRRGLYPVDWGRGPMALPLDELPNDQGRGEWLE